MIFTPHIVVGMAIGAKTQNLGLIIILGLLFHFAMDKIPHWDYVNSGIRNFPRTKNFKALFSDFFKIAIDGLFGLLIVFLCIWQKGVFTPRYLLFILLGIFFSILPDIDLAFSFLLLPQKISKKYFAFHEKYLHYSEDKEKEGKITFLGIITQILMIIIALSFFFLD